ncbi:esterase/lipase [Mycolicibacterium aurum]|uniref:Esterase/lipase n=2 Tax=Mycolicibacterium aurum TaxID=1791 RepID=A0A3S5EJF9_MYCAU|nr:esterase/lipase [Mycolicibacterium aurum]
MAEIGDAAVPALGRLIPVRLYRPTRVCAEPAPVVVYFHGGGLVMGSNHSFEPLARGLAHSSGAVVVAVDYRLAPEHPPPAQFDDAFVATEWVAEQAATLGVDPTRLAVAGDSAGGGVAAAVALAARDHHGPQILVQVLMYPGVDRDMGTPSVTDMPDAPMLTHDDIVYLHDLADVGAETPHSPYRVPAFATDLRGLPQAIVVTAASDPIRDWGERYAERMRQAGVQTTVTRYPGVYHGFLMRYDTTARGRLALAETGALLQAKFTCPLHF